MDEKILPALPASVHLNQAFRNQRITDSIQAVAQAGADKDESRLQAACMEMESLFLTHLLKEMRATIDKSGFISGGQAEEIFTSLLDVEISRKMSAAGGIGLSKILLEQLRAKGGRKDDPES
jgi:flagellar protein FlgJ